MVIAEELRQEINVEREIPNLRENVKNSIRQRGKWSVICDTHISKIQPYAIPFKYWRPLTEWAQGQGLCVSEKRNPYGVRYIVFTL